MRELFRVWWPGVKLTIALVLTGIFWSGIAWCYQAIAGWLPDTIYRTIAWAFSIVFYPIALGLIADLVLNFKMRR